MEWSFLTTLVMLGLGGGFVPGTVRLLGRESGEWRRRQVAGRPATPKQNPVARVVGPSERDVLSSSPGPVHIENSTLRAPGIT